MSASTIIICLFLLLIAHPHPWQHLTFLASCVIISITSYKRTVDALRIEGLLSILL